VHNLIESNWIEVGDLDKIYNNKRARDACLSTLRDEQTQKNDGQQSKTNHHNHHIKNQQNTVLTTTNHKTKQQPVYSLTEHLGAK
jgi:Zn-finger nucleic acid-binding protein